MVMTAEEVWLMASARAEATPMLTAILTTVPAEASILAEETITLTLADEFQMAEELRPSTTTERGETRIQTTPAGRILTPRREAEQIRNKTDRAHGVLRATLTIPVTRLTHHHETALSVMVATVVAVQEVILRHHQEVAVTAEAEAETNADSKTTIVHET